MPTQAQPTPQRVPAFSLEQATAPLPGYGVVWADTQRTRPPLKAGRLVVQYAGGMLVGAGGGLILALGAYAAGAGLEDCDNSEDIFCGLGYAAMGLLVGYTVGSAAGVYFFGNKQDQAAPFLTTLGGSMGGFLVLVLAAGALDGGDQNDFVELLIASMPTFGAMVAYNAARRYPDWHTPSTSALLSTEGGAWSLGMPAIAPQPDPLTLGQTKAYRVSLLRVGL